MVNKQSSIAVITILLVGFSSLQNSKAETNANSPDKASVVIQKVVPVIAEIPISEKKSTPLPLVLSPQPPRTLSMPVAVKPIRPAPQDILGKRVEEAIKISTRRYLTANIHTPWQVMHGMLALRRDYQLKQGTKKINALDWISKGQKFQGEPWFQKTKFGGRGHKFNKAYAFEGHPNQCFALLSMSGLPLDHKFQTPSGSITVQDIVNNAKMEVNDREEMTWTLWALSRYLPAEAEWRNKKGDVWSMERLVRTQLNVNVYKAPCGGTHSLFALAFARKYYLKKHRYLRGVWLEADQKIKRYIQEARVYQNSDGTFSTEHFNGKGYKRDFKTRLSTSGHVLEFLVMAASDKQLKEPWLRKGINTVAMELLNNRRRPAECGGLYHAMDALVIYRNRTNPIPTNPKPVMAKSIKKGWKRRVH